VNRTPEERAAAVRSLVRAARLLARNPGELVARIARSSGLSEAGVRLALERHLEIDPSEEDLAHLVARTHEASRVHVILSSTVFVGALRAMAVARASAPRVTVRPSRRDPVFASALIETLGDPELSLAAEAGPAAIDAGEIHVYGRDETTASLRAAARPGVIVRAHGSGLGVACISAVADAECAAELVAADVVPFDQRGCLSPRIVFVEGDGARAEAVATMLDAALARASVSVPRGALAPEERAEAVRYMETVAFSGRLYRGEEHAVGVSATLALPPPGRHVHVLAVPDAQALEVRLEPIAHAVVAFGTDDPVAFTFAAPAHARISVLGAMQRPPLDGPVDLRVLSESRRAPSRTPGPP
jgi:hypothetical protein